MKDQVESIDGQYLNTSVYSPLVGSNYIKLPDEFLFVLMCFVLTIN